MDTIQACKAILARMRCLGAPLQAAVLGSACVEDMIREMSRPASNRASDLTDAEWFTDYLKLRPPYNAIEFIPTPLISPMEDYGYLSSLRDSQPHLVVLVLGNIEFHDGNYASSTIVRQLVSHITQIRAIPSIKCIAIMGAIFCEGNNAAFPPERALTRVKALNHHFHKLLPKDGVTIFHDLPCLVLDPTTGEKHCIDDVFELLYIYLDELSELVHCRL